MSLSSHKMVVGDCVVTTMSNCPDRTAPTDHGAVPAEDPKKTWGFV